MRRKQLLLPQLFAAAIMVCVATSAGAAQVCTTQSVGNQEFRGISGDSDTNVIAVGKKGVIYRYDGSAWSAMAGPGNEDLNDVEVVDANTAFAVGRDGEVLQLAGGVWTSIGGFTKEDLLGVWAASPTEVYVVGNKGTLYRYDGSSWTDQSAAASTDNKDIEDAWGDANFFYAVAEDGRLYRYDRNAAGWLPPDTSCTIGARFEDLWGDGSGNVYLVGQKNVHRYDGSSCPVVATASENLQGVSGWTQDGDVLAVGKKGTVFEYDGSTWTETQQGNNEFLDDWLSPAGNAYYAGKKKELTVCQCTDCPVLGLPQFVVTHDSYGIHCQDEVVQVQVIDSSTGTPKIDYNAQVTLDTQSGFGSWSPVAGSGPFDDATLNDGLATYDWPLGESAAAFALSYREGPASIDIDVYQASDTGIRDNDSEGIIVFSASGFTLTAAPLSNPPPAVIVPFSAAQVAGVDFAVHIAAFGQTPNDPVCGVIENYTGPQVLKFWSDYVDPGSGTRAVTIDASPVATSEAAAANSPSVFVNGQAVVTAKYKDVGRIRINVKDDSLAHPDLPNGIRGATAGFVVKPDHFELTNIEDSLGNPNPAAADAAGPAFVAAGEAFSVTATAYDAEGDVTPNYGQESIPETVRLTAGLVDPAAGDNPPLGMPTGFGPFAAGQAVGNSFSWPEVGIVTLLPSVGDGSYLDAGDVPGLASGNVGRFHAHHFTATLNTPTFATGCSGGSFTYIGEVFAYS
ncbi:MAG: hypothetical protein OEO82_03615, partial [Gammaproteobacteria bacterium]|nr:hypothetical protein [Gammaproteobacteria bacterium]